MKDAKFSNDLATNSWLNLQVDQLQSRRRYERSLGEEEERGGEEERVMMLSSRMI